MLGNITIRNFGLIDNLNLELSPGLNALSGETGAGKSIIIEALRVCLGLRINQSQIRNPKLPCIIETVFELHNEIIKRNAILADF